MKHGTNIEAQDKDQCTPLHLAAIQWDISEESNHLLQLMQILKLKTMINGLLYIGLLIMDIQKQYRELIAAHANIEAQDKDQRTPLHLAAYKGHIEAIKALIEAHANIEAQNNRSTVLHYIWLL